ncbi:hypothetical protein CR205_11160 [Alteribacter lacisalsi]|uniref:Uncharacterized protein n=1 Tax=Alteribacter lacisalsi TaxID=2045244 RepID=A0A2W0HNC8_9BACI|nr:hypothetical protein [Alteribacter lacisalsi]PYZ99085.1 hypothetical protein CR205_11160 [Alteribacter lacisalsi]
MNLFLIIALTLGLIIVGFIREVLSLKRLTDEINFITEYNNDYINYIENFLGKQPSIQEPSLHGKLLKNAPKAQRLLGEFGIINYKPAGTLTYIPNHQLLINVINSLRNPRLISEEFKMVYNHLIMRIGYLEELHEETKKGLKNPLVLLREGVKFFVTLPIELLYWTGLIQYPTLYKLTNNWFIRFLNFIAIITGFVSSIVSITIGWDAFWEFISNL